MILIGQVLWSRVKERMMYCLYEMGGIELKQGSLMYQGSAQEWTHGHYEHIWNGFLYVICSTVTFSVRICAIPCDFEVPVSP